MKNNNNTPLIQSFAATDKGRRPNNEDTIAFFEPTDPKERQQSGCIYIVADGVGGASIGERASKFAAEKVLYEYLKHPEVEPATRLKQAIVKANREIYVYAEQNSIRMATTMTIAVILENSLIAANVGDSRVYLIRAGEVKQITNDHNVVGELVRNGAMTEAEALKSKAKNKLTRSIGGNDEVQADTFVVPLLPNDKILLCSDGLTRYALKADIGKLAASGTPKQVATAAIEFAKKMGNGGADNISVISVAYEPTTPVNAIDPSLQETIVSDLTKTEPGLEKNITKDSRQRLVMFSLIGVVLVALLGSAAYFLFGKGTASSVDATMSVTSTIPEASQAATTLPPSQTPEPNTETPTATIDPAILQTLVVASPVTATVKDDCPEFLRVRSYPAANDAIAPEIGRLQCGESIQLRGKYTDTNGAKWLLIYYPDDAGNEQTAWVFANTVDLTQDADNQLPVIVVTPPPTATVAPTFTVSPQPTVGLQLEGKIQCKYQVAEGDGLISIAQKFGIQDYGVIFCAQDNTATCVINSQDPNSVIGVGWLLIIPNIDSAVCTQNNGTVQP